MAGESTAYILAEEHDIRLDEALARLAPRRLLGEDCALHLRVVVRPTALDAALARETPVRLDDLVVGHFRNAFQRVDVLVARIRSPCGVRGVTPNEDSPG
jgi:hypothetical protein